MKRRTLLGGLLATAITGLLNLRFSVPHVMAATVEKIKVYSLAAKDYIVTDRVVKSEAEWRQQLSDQEFHITREQGTEAAFSGRYWNNHDKGIYRCVCCDQDLFHSDTKFESGSGWPSFYQPVAKENVATEVDTKFFMVRTEVHCSRCDGHLGHIFDDGPKPTGLRYCINSASLTFIEENKVD